MSSSLSIRRPFAAATAFAVLVGGLVLAPAVAAPAFASNTSDTAALTALITADRGTAYKTSPSLTAFAKSNAAGAAKNPITWEPNYNKFPKELVGNAVPEDVYIIAAALPKSYKPSVDDIYEILLSYTDEDENSILSTDAYDWAGVSFVTNKTGKFAGKFAVVTLANYESSPVEFITAATPKIKGTVKVGSLLTAVAGTWKPSSTALSYQWIVGGETYSSETTFVVPADAAGKAITLKVTGTNEGYRDAVKTVVTKKAAKGMFSVTSPVATGKRNVGEWLDAGELFEYKTSPVTEPSLSFQWYRGTAKIEGATDNDYFQLPADKGKKISVVITITGNGYTTYSKQSSTKLVTAAPLLKGTYTPSISRETELVELGTVLTATPGGEWTADAEVVNTLAASAAVTYSYQWYVGGKAVAKATKATFTIPASAVNKSITVEVTGTLAGYAPTKVLSNEVGPVTEKEWTSAPDYVSISGSYVKGKKITAVVPATDPTGATLTYQWIGGDDKPIKGETSKTHTITSKDIANGWIQIKVTVKKPGYRTLIVFGNTGLG